MNLRPLAAAGIVALFAILAEPTAFAFPDPPKPTEPANATAGRTTYSSVDPVKPDEPRLPAGTVALADADLKAALELYEKISQRSVIPSGKLPGARFSYRLDIALPRREVLQALDTLFAQQGITMVTMGSNFAKAVPEGQATLEAAPELTWPAPLLPESNTYIQYSVRLHHREVNDAVHLVQPFLRLPNSLLTMPSSNTIIIRDYSSNVRRILGVLEKFDTPDTGEALPGDRKPRRIPSAPRQ